MTNGPTEQQTDGQTDRQTNGPTTRLLELVRTAKKRRKKVSELKLKINVNVLIHDPKSFMTKVSMEKKYIFSKLIVRRN